jgi:hypothetical protein
LKHIAQVLSIDLKPEIVVSLVSDIRNVRTLQIPVLRITFDLSTVVVRSPVLEEVYNLNRTICYSKPLQHRILAENGNVDDMERRNYRKRLVCWYLDLRIDYTVDRNTIHQPVFVFEMYLPLETPGCYGILCVG